MNTWRNMLQKKLSENNESFADIEKMTIDDSGLDVEFDDGFGAACGESFFAWSKEWVYFCLEYDGAESVGCVPRNPSGVKPYHVG